MKHLTYIFPTKPTKAPEQAMKPLFRRDLTTRQDQLQKEGVGFDFMLTSFTSAMMPTYREIDMYKIIGTASILLALTAPSFAIDSTFVHSLRADNGDFEAPGQVAGQPSLATGGAAHALQIGSMELGGGTATAKCTGVSPRQYDPVSPDCRN